MLQPQLPPQQPPATGPSLTLLAFLNAAFETGIENPLDQAITVAGKEAGLSTEGYAKVDEIPYDFVRKRLTIVVESTGEPGSHLIITKGSFNAVVETNTGAVALWQSLGFRILATIPEGFRHPTKGYVGLHIMYRQL